MAQEYQAFLFEDFDFEGCNTTKESVKAALTAAGLDVWPHPTPYGCIIVEARFNPIFTLEKMALCCTVYIKESHGERFMQGPTVIPGVGQ